MCLWKQINENLVLDVFVSDEFKGNENILTFVAFSLCHCYCEFTWTYASWFSYTLYDFLDTFYII